MIRAPRRSAIKVLANLKAEDYLWGTPESPEFSSVQGLMNEFQSHAAHEQKWLSQYKDAAEETDDPLIRFLLGLIVADEERHHELTGRMISKLKDELAWTRAEGTRRRPAIKSAQVKRLMASVESFLAAERKGIKDYEKLRQTSEGLFRNVFALLYTTMICDSQKHIGILEFLRDNLKKPRRKR